MAATHYYEEYVSHTFKQLRATGMIAVCHACLVQRASIKTKYGLGEDVMCIVFLDSSHMENGRKIMHGVSLLLKCVSIIQTLVHDGIAVGHYCFGRAMQPSTQRLVKCNQYIWLWHQVRMEELEEVTAALMWEGSLELKYWMLHTSYTNDGMSRGDFRVLSDYETVIKIEPQIVVEPLWVVSRTWLRTLHRFIMSSMSFRDDAWAHIELHILGRHGYESVMGVIFARYQYNVGQ